MKPPSWRWDVRFTFLPGTDARVAQDTLKRAGMWSPLTWSRRRRL